MIFYIQKAELMSPKRKKRVIRKMERGKILFFLKLAIILRHQILYMDIINSFSLFDTQIQLIFILL